MSIFAGYVLPIIYLVGISLLLMRNKYLQEHGFSRWFIAVFFIVKCISGIVNDSISINHHGDVLYYFSDGYHLYKLFLDSPAAFFDAFKEMFAQADFDLFNSHSGFIRSVFEAIKLLHFFANFFSLGNVYTNTILYNGVAALLLLRCWVFLNNYTGNWVTGSFVFLLPSSFFYTSNILKEGLCTILISMLIPLCYAAFKGVSIKQFARLVILFVLLFFLKFLIAVTFLLAISGWWFMNKYPLRKYGYIFLVSSIVIITFFTAKYIDPALDFPGIIAHRQQEFIDLKARSAIAVHQPSPDFKGFVKTLPFAINTVLFKPLPGEGKSYAYLINTLEIFCFWAFILWLAIKNKFVPVFSNISPFCWAMFLYGVANLLIIGYIVPNIGAMLRYRSIFLPWTGIFFWYLFNGSQWIVNTHQNRLKRLLHLHR